MNQTCPTPPAAEAPSPAITGYRTLSADDVVLINALKAQGERLNVLLTTIAERNHAAMPPMYEGPETTKAEAAVHRSNDALFEARRALQTGLMWAVRAVANPEGFA